MPTTPPPPTLIVSDDDDSQLCAPGEEAIGEICDKANDVSDQHPSPPWSPPPPNNPVQVSTPSATLTLSDHDDETMSAEAIMQLLEEDDVNVDKDPPVSPLPPPPPPPPSNPMPAVKQGIQLKTVLLWKGFDWLGYDVSSDGLHVTRVWCNTCREYAKSKPVRSLLNDGQSQCCKDIDRYVVGTNTVKKSNIVDHGSKSSIHAKAVQAMQAAKASSSKSPAPASDIRRLIHRMDNATAERMCKLMDWAYVVAKKELSFAVFPTLVNTEIKHGSDIGSSYSNAKGCKTFVMAIGECLLDDLKLLFDRKPFYCSLMFDGSSDKTMTEKEAISIKVIDANGVPRIFSLG